MHWGYRTGCDWGHGETSRQRSVTGAWLHGLRQCMVYSQPWECSYKLNDQLIRKRLTASMNYLQRTSWRIMIS